MRQSPAAPIVATTDPSAARPDRREKNQGMNWISRRWRLGIYMRDGFCCAYCGRGVEKPGVTLTLDHLKPYSQGGAVTAARNLITCCMDCNRSRCTRSLAVFVPLVAALHQRDAAEVLAYIRRQVRRVVNVKAAGSILAQRGSCRKVLDVVAQGDPIR